MMQLTQNEVRIVKSILGQTSAEIYLFGSRVRGTARPDSDLDICLKKSDLEIPLEEMANLREDFVNSDLPFPVDLVDYRLLSDDFRRIIVNEWVTLHRL